MQIRDLCPVTRLAALHALYERGYLLAERLVPELELPFTSAVSCVAGEPRLCLSTVARDRYTAAFRLHYEPEEVSAAAAVDLCIKVYRDARVAEALECPERPPWRAADREDPQAVEFLDDQWQRNAMMVKWLDYLLERGHGFVHASRPRQQSA